MVVAKIEDGSVTGVGEAVPYTRYDQTVEKSLITIRELAAQYSSNLTRDLLRQVHPPDAARNALDCALWDLEAKKSGEPVWQRAGLPEPIPTVGVYSLSLDTPEHLAQSANESSTFPILKIKLGCQQVVDSVAAVRRACPNTRIIVDANEAWDAESLLQYLPELTRLKVEMIEQPLPAHADAELDDIECNIPLCADESFHDAKDLERLATRYDIFNIKLDKTGGLTEALALAAAIRNTGKKIMVGSMMATSLGLAPALLVAHDATYVDLDSSVWLANDRTYGIKFEHGILQPTDRRLWG